MGNGCFTHSTAVTSEDEIDPPLQARGAPGEERPELPLPSSESVEGETPLGVAASDERTNVELPPDRSFEWASVTACLGSWGQLEGLPFRATQNEASPTEEWANAAAIPSDNRNLFQADPAFNTVTDANLKNSAKLPPDFNSWYEASRRSEDRLELFWHWRHGLNRSHQIPGVDEINIAQAVVQKDLAAIWKDQEEQWKSEEQQLPPNEGPEAIEKEVFLHSEPINSTESQPLSNATLLLDDGTKNRNESNRHYTSSDSHMKPPDRSDPAQDVYEMNEADVNRNPNQGRVIEEVSLHTQLHQIINSTESQCDHASPQPRGDGTQLNLPERPNTDEGDVGHSPTDAEREP
jgi:hypothetical protein